VTAAPELLTLIRWFGAAYLLWLGIRALLLPPVAVSVTDAGSPAMHRPWQGPLRIGFISNLLHPGQVVFYTSMLPQFIDPAADPTAQVIVLGAVFVAMVLSWFTAYALVASAIRIGRWRRLTPLLTRVTGVVLIGFAIRVAARW
jgi:threonine/homoserine/homoserine lactone efflux protein